jgi:hypothetical protein
MIAHLSHECRKNQGENRITQNEWREIAKKEHERRRKEQQKLDQLLASLRKDAVA